MIPPDRFARLTSDLPGPPTGRRYRPFFEIILPLVIAGLLDTLTPAYQSREIARRMPNAELIELWRSSHFSMMERPEVVIPAMQRFFDHRARW